MQTPVTALFLLKEAQEHLQQFPLWNKEGLRTVAMEHEMKARTLIEAVEKAHCGSMGGLSVGFPTGEGALRMRLDYLLKAYGGVVGK